MTGSSSLSGAIRNCSPSRLPLLGQKGPDTGGTGSMVANANARRMGVFVMAVLVGLASGSNYVYSAYAPQLATELVISSTQVNLIGLAGNLGMYLAGPFWGKIVDSYGQRYPLLIGGFLTLTGYSLVRAFYEHAIALRSSPSDDVSTFRLLLLAFCMFITGMGGSAGLTGSVNAAAKSFPDKTRASATGTVLAGFGLSAFLFSTIGHVMYKGDAGGLLLLLAIGTGVPMIVGSFIVRPVPPQKGREEQGYDPIPSGPDIVVDDDNEPGGAVVAERRSTSLELIRSRSPTAPTRHHRPSFESASIAPFEPSLPSLAAGPVEPSPSELAYSPLDLLRSTDFHILFVILALLCGTGLMYINNAGTVALALAREGQWKYDVKVISAWQAKQVATVSVWNCAGRILGGVFSDFCKLKFQMKRIWFLPMVAALFVISQLAALSVTSVEHLWVVSTLLGGSYGSLFNVVPMLVLEWFGMKHFSQNYGWICVAPVIGGNTFNLLFGRVYDSNTVGKIGSPHAGLEAGTDLLRRVLKRGGVSLPDDGSHDCLVGEHCYATAFKVAAFGCFLALLLSLWAGARRQWPKREKRRALRLDSEPLVGGEA